MEYHKAMTSDLTTTDSNNNNNSHHHHHNRRKKRTGKQQQLGSLSLSKKPPVKSVSITDPNINQGNISLREQQQQRISMKNPLSWKKRWSQWFLSCSSDRTSYIKSNPIIISIEVRYYLFFLYYLTTTPVVYN
jgi:alpha-D-ribose 1-methylphosphonate 5-triphosphate diphosphatase PhnM